MPKLAPLFLLILLLWPAQTMAMATPWQDDGAVGVRLISAYEGVGQKKTIPLGLEVRMEPGWHTYWRSPGAAGLPPQFDWKNSETVAGNLRTATVYFPPPRRYDDHGLETIGYHDHVIFPIDAELSRVGYPLNIDTTLNLLVCS